MVTINPRNYFVRCIQRIDGGRSIAVTLPKRFAKELEILVGDHVTITKSERAIIVQKYIPTPA